MSYFREKPARSSGEDWLCPHCYRRERYTRYLVCTCDMIPLVQDRKQYWHRVSLGEAPDAGAVTNRLAEGRLLGERSAEQLMVDSLRGLRGCVHCHMSSEELWAGADMYQAIASNAAALNALLHALGQPAAQQDGSAANWVQLEPEGVARHFGLCQDGHRWELAFGPPADASALDGYRQMLMDRCTQEAAGYLILLDLSAENAELLVCRELDRLARLHAGQFPFPQRAAAVLLLPEDAGPTKYRWVHDRLKTMFPDQELWVVKDLEQMNDVLLQALQQLLGLWVPQTEESVPENSIDADAGR